MQVLDVPLQIKIIKKYGFTLGVINMPIPKPNKKEKNSDFMSRCISDLESKKEFKNNKQRAAVCYQQITRKNKKS